MNLRSSDLLKSIHMTWELWHGVYWDLAFGPLFVCGELWMMEAHLGIGVCTI